MAEELPLLKQTLRVTALVLVPIVIFLGIVSTAALAIAPASPRASAPAALGDKAAAASPEGDKAAAPRGARASAKLAPNKL